MELYEIAAELDEYISMIKLPDDLDNREKLCYLFGRIEAYNFVLQRELDEGYYVDMRQR